MAVGTEDEMVVWSWGKKDGGNMESMFVGWDPNRGGTERRCNGLARQASDGKWSECLARRSLARRAPGGAVVCGSIYLRPRK